MDNTKRPPIMYKLLRLFFRVAFNLVARIDVKGMERIPLEGPLVVTANHTSVYEGPLVFCIFPRPITAMAKLEYQNSLIGKLVLTPLDAIYIARGEVDRTALKEFLKRLKAGAALGIAPEGTRSRTGQLQAGQEGVAYVALQSDAWILPIGIWGHEQALAHFRRLRRPPVTLRVGEPFRLEADPSLSRKENVRAGTQRIMHAIAALLPPHYRGVYAHELSELPPPSA